MSSEELTRCAEEERKFRGAVEYQPASVERYNALICNEVGCYIFCIVVGIYTNNVIRLMIVIDRV